jgi:uroporphyrinogen decarboxylase
MYRKWNLPFLRQATAICKRYGIPSHNHVGGKSALLIEMLTTTDMTVVEPLERPPSGDTPLAEMKLKYGQRFCLKGNVNTFDTLQHGSAEQVRAESLRCIRDAGSGGGFVLSSGDQVPLETPEANLSAMVEVAQELGVYPLDMPAIEKAIEEAESGRWAAS